MGAHGGGDMVDIVLEDEPDPQDRPPAPPLSPKAAVLGSPTALRVLWTATPDEAPLGIGTADGLWLSVCEDRTALLARDADTGEPRWRTDLPDGEAVAGCSAPVPAVHSIACVVGQGDAFSLVAVSIDDGTEIGRSLLPDTALPTLVATEGLDVLLVSTQPDGGGIVTRRSSLDGTERGTTPVPAPATPPHDQGLGQAVAGGLVAFSGALDAILELDTGTVLDVLVAPNTDNLSFVTPSPLADGGVVLSVSVSVTRPRQGSCSTWAAESGSR